MKIKVGMQNMRKSFCLKVDCEVGKAWLDDTELNMDVKAFASSLLSVVSSWEHEMVDPTILDGLSYFVRIQNDDGKVVSYSGQNKFPQNFQVFTKLLEENGVKF